MIRRVITAYFQWSGKHPWIVFLGAILLFLVIVNAFFRILFDLPPPFSLSDLRSLFRMLLNGLLAFGAGNILWPLVIVLILNRKYVRGISRMIPKPITAPFRWWAKHPWTVFWASIPVFYLLGGLFQPSVFVARTMALLLALVLISSFIRGMYLQWQRSRILLAVAYIVIVLFILQISVQLAMRHSAYRVRRYDAEVTATRKNAATAQEAYFEDHDTYTSNIGSLTGFNQGTNVIITMEATTTTYVITGTMTEGCEAYTGRWVIDSTTGKIDGTPCSR